MKFGLQILSWMMGCAALVACADANNKCGDKVLALMPNAAGVESFQEIRLTTLNNPYVLSGGAARVYYDTPITDAGYVGDVARPQYTRAGDLCVPTDAASSLSVSLYAVFERIFRFEQSIGVADMLTWPRTVGVDVQLRSQEGITHNNAVYVGSADAIAILPYKVGGTPMVINLGIMAHEHFHAHFNKQVMRVVELRTAVNHAVDAMFYPGTTKPSPENLGKLDLRTARDLNGLVLRAWNEGLADFYGAIFSGDTNFVDKSLPMAQGTRALTPNVRPFLSATEFRIVALVSTSKQIIGTAYDQGSNLARLMFVLAHSGAEPPEAFLARILRRLSALPEVISPQYNKKVISLEDIVPVLLAGYTANAKGCQALRSSMSTLVMVKGIAQCSAL